jgi:hypothetical protein
MYPSKPKPGSFDMGRDQVCPPGKSAVYVSTFSLLTLLQLALRFAGAIERVTQGMCDIGQALPRFQTYEKLFPSSGRLNLALVDVYESVVLFCIETIKFLRSNSISETPIFEHCSRGRKCDVNTELPPHRKLKGDFGVRLRTLGGGC